MQVPATSWPARSGCEASTPVSRSATTALPDGVDGAVDAGPSRSSAATTGRRTGVVGRGLGGPDAVELDAADVAVGAQVGDDGGAGRDAMKAMRRAGIESERRPRQQRGCWPGSMRTVPGAKVTM